MKHNVEGDPRGNNRDLRNHIRKLEDYVHASENRKNQYEGFRQNQQKVLEELQKLKVENEELRRDTGELLRRNPSDNYRGHQADYEYKYRPLENSLANNRNLKVSPPITQNRINDRVATASYDRDY